MISLNTISQQFTRADGTIQSVFDNLSLTIPTGNFVSVVGPSGCGKSTLLKIISGLLKPTSGSVTIANEAITKPHNRASLVFQKPNLLPWLTTLENILFPIKHRHGKVSEEQTSEARYLLSMIGLAEHADKRPQALSGGMQQRVAIARALISNSDILLMDEPFSALDAMTRERLGFELQALLSNSNKTTLFITHSIPEAVLLSDKVIVLDAGPARIVDEIDINLPSERNIETLNDPSFTHYCDLIRHYFYQTPAQAAAGAH
ncbi:ABC transporter ATP-binding protein [Halioxenophilus sp. WMMB6]|uniref:ABC transporter ATP-binding protein n=1 Tax=Halioxenophilus sp. WMMB6 TaxID=3073815 RepID=UPI00295E315F|nr:ABC transporter ATP-binding protein [Halioxenophilus sp. WMMB6]